MPLRKTTSRRQFVRQTSGVVAACFAGLKTKVGSGKPAAIERVGIGYIGVGRRARQLMDLPPEAQIVAVADVNHDRADQIAVEKKCKAYYDYRDLLDAPDVDAVIIATPDHWHALPSIHACQAGKDVYCEKPLALTVREGRVMVDAARKYDRVVQTGSQQRSTPANDFACRFVREGHLGPIHTIIGQNYPSPWECALPGQAITEGIDWDAWCGSTEPRPYHNDIYTPRANPGWISFRPYSGGEMTGWGAHGLDQVQCALGMDESGPVEVWTEGNTFDPLIYRGAESRTRGNAICGQPSVFFRYRNGEILQLADGPGGGAVFIGERGKISIDRGKFTVDPPGLTEVLEPQAEIRGEPTKMHLQNWIDCIKMRERPVADVEIGQRSATVCHLGNIARWVGHPLKWDPVREEFADDADANALLQREHRSPYELPKLV
jgi:predicted dehydrogenase